MKFTKISILIIAYFFLQNNVWAEDVQQTAKIRLFGQNGLAVNLYKNASCFGEGEKIEISGLLGKSFASLFHLAGNSSIGMTETAYSKNVSAKTSLGSKAFYNEYEIPSEVSSVITAAIAGLDNHKSDTSKISFIPETGAQYEEHFDIGSGIATLSIYKIAEDGSSTPVKFQEVCSCSGCPSAFKVH